MLGIALLVGAIVVLDLRLLGAWRTAPLAAVARPAVVVAATGLAIALPSGLALLSVQASDYAANPFLWVKFAAILVGLANIAALRLAGDWMAEDRAGRGAVAGLLSLLAWLTALIAGRLIAYW